MNDENSGNINVSNMDGSKTRYEPGSSCCGSSALPAAGMPMTVQVCDPRVCCSTGSFAPLDIKDIFKMSESDEFLSKIIEEAAENANLYVHAKQTDNGCGDMEGIETLRKNLNISIDRIVYYCIGRGFMSGGFEYDLDSVATELSVAGGK